MKKLGTHVWLDLETTGLDAEHDDVLEIGIVITDNELNVLSTFNSLVGGDIAKCDDFVASMHEKNGLFEELAESFALMLNESSLSAVTKRVVSFITQYCETKAAVLCNNSVHFDESFLRAKMPDVLDCLHYRRIDVSTLRRVYRDESKGAISGKKPDCDHRALGDALTALSEYKRLNKDFKNWVIGDYLKNKSM